MISINDAGQELGEYFPTLADSAYIEDFAIMASLLSSKDALAKPLADLEAKILQRKLDTLRQEAENQRQVDTQNNKKNIDWEQGNYSGYFVGWIESFVSGPVPAAARTDGLSKVLTRELERFEVAAGFQLGALTGKADILMGQAGADFNRQLRAGRPIKDVGAGKEHGEFTHRLQWYLAGTSGLLKNSASDLYKVIPNHSTKLIGNSTQYLWAWLLDRNPPNRRLPGNEFDTQDMWDWRSPENLSQCLKDDIDLIDRYPVLCAVLLKRFNKRSQESLKEYFARKIPQEVKDEVRAKLEKQKSEGKTAAFGVFYKR